MHNSHRRLTPLIVAFSFTTLLAACGDPPTDPQPLLQPQVARVDRNVSIAAMPIHELAPGYLGIATDIADDGTITGNVGLPSPRPFLWREGVLTTLPVPAGASYAESWAVNERGHLAVRGWFPQATFSVARAYLWTPEAGYTDIGTLGFHSAQVQGMNDLDHLVGYSAVSSVFPAVQAFIWKPGSPMTTLVPEIFTVALDINNAGDVIINGPGARLKRADGTLVYLIGGSQALDLNEHGNSVGHGVLSSSPLLTHAYTWDRNGTPVDLTPDLIEGRGSATAINDDGVIAGHIEFQPFVWVNGRRYALATLGSGAYPTAINNAGRIVGYARTASANVPVYWDVLRVPAVVLGDLTSRITALVETGAVGAGPAHALLQIVEQATRAVDDDRMAAARAQLRAFVALVRAHQGSGQLAAAQAAELIALAEEVLAML